MTWSYDVALTQEKDQVRWLVGDTTISDQLVADEEIEWALDQEGGVFAAAALVAETLSNQFARVVDKQVGDLKIKTADRVKNYSQLADRLRRRVLLNTSGLVMSAQSRAEKLEDVLDTDMVPPFFTREMHSVDEPDLRNLRDDT